MSQLPNQNDNEEQDDNRPLTLEEQRARLRQLIIMGKERGYITYAEINDALPDDMSDADQIDNIVTMISGLGIQVTEHTPDAEDILMGDNTANMTDDDAVAEAEAALSSADSEFGRTTDPVRMYMREMGQVDLLTREDEIIIAKKIENALKNMVQAISACPGSVAEILALIERIRADEIKVDEVVEAIIDPNEVLLNELGLGHLESSAPAESAEVAENDEDADSDEETDEEADAEAISSANLEELKQKTLEHFRTIEQDYNKMVAALTKHDSKHASYLEYRDAIAAKLLEVRFATRQIESLSSSLRARVDNIRKLEPELTRLKPGMPDYQQIMMTLAPLQEPLSYSLASMMQKNINVYSGNDKRFGQLRDALLFMVLGLVISVILLSGLLVREARRHFRTARVDPLTGLANRLALLEKMESYVSRDTPFGLILIDINDFRDINSKFGYSTGDILLQELAKRLRALCENGEWVARLGGDQLAMLQRDSSDLRQVRELVARVLHSIKQDIIIDNYPFRLEVGIGIAFFPTDSNQTQELLSRAEQALFHSRKTHVPYVIYDSSLLNETTRRKHLASDMVMALEHNALELYYQPIVNLESGRCEAVEALLRWRHPELGFIPPNEVIQVAEEFQLAEKLGSWVDRKSVV